jgi:hypothetical protein
LGFVIGGVAEKVPERIIRLVYLYAYLPQENKSAFYIIPGLATIYNERALKEPGREWCISNVRVRILMPAQRILYVIENYPEHLLVSMIC